MKKINKINMISIILIILTFIIVSCCFLLSSSFNIDSIISQFEHAELHYILLSGFCGIAGNYIKGIRWKKHQCNEKRKMSSAFGFFCISLGCLSDLIIPRSGELIRIKVTQRKCGGKFTEIMSGIILERITDAVIVISLLMFSAYAGFKLVTLSDSMTDVIAMVLRILTVISLFFWLFIKKVKAFARARLALATLINYFKSSMRYFNFTYAGMVLFLLSSTAWLLYYLQTYYALIAVFGNHITIKQSLFVFLAGTVGMMIPIQGGIGTYHTSVMLALRPFSNDINANLAFALSMHLTYVVSIFISTFVIWAYLSVERLLSKEKNYECNRIE
ncbi:flippase-like domain-containing protein [Pectobacterium parvum]|uniref:lysylphosphatidylglycerol synthase transmembrane domain-containing protein n=1 Tax=Pectobacterium TaxID=122277 RepID=UPI000502443A|nr:MULTISPECIES: lysylphosphatidylglycerol synthase transmembrane domain-containing protein [Pectobacterium]GKW40881.1 hypothetical protein PEC301879_07400 [Pectobacterium carotovorum subsp. carotovorum]KFX10611.1 hypothetical protein KP17_18160 [Pectobacterium parvum]MCU1800692.1 flippase-like domain-containing protein [Pectobacterium parvum]UFK38891.1 flippase-like domain-containing protein [Pectobacterium parvum]UVD97012.1 flippase-like domain-containing protein [Pectobacterium parvum]